MSDLQVCPYCRMAFTDDGPAKLFCTACGMAHHEDCYMENGGCTVFGCPRAPADDPKLQLSPQDLGGVMMTPAGHYTSQYGGPLGLAQPASAAGYGQYVYPQPGMAVRLPKNRTTYIVLGIFLGMFGAHNFYAGYTGKAVGQLCLSVLTLFYLAIVSWIWAVVEICIVDKDSAGIQFS